MNVFCSWSGGKESTLALDREMRDGSKVDFLINMLPADDSTGGHGLPDDFYVKQARSIGVEMKQTRTNWDNYEENFSDLIVNIHPKKGIFGDVYLEGHREWVENKGEELGFMVSEPLWGDEPERLFREYLERGYEGIVVKLDPEVIPVKWLGKKLDEDFLEWLLEKEICPLGEEGEFHTATIDGPVFDRRMEVKIGDRKKYGDQIAIELEDYRLV